MHKIRFNGGSHDGEWLNVDQSVIDRGLIQRLAKDNRPSRYDLRRTAGLADKVVQTETYRIHSYYGLEWTRPYYLAVIEGVEPTPAMIVASDPDNVEPK